MRKNIILVIGLFFLLLVPFNVEALTGSTTIKCNSTKISPGTSTTCTLSANITSGKATGIQGYIKVGSNLTLGTVTTNSSWIGDGNGGYIVLYGQEVSGSFTIATFTVTASSTVSNGADSSVYLSDFFMSDTNDTETTFTSSLNVRIPSNINTLKSLSLSGIPIDFSSDVTSYTVSVDTLSTVVTAVATDSKATVTGTGTKTLNYGSNTINIVVTSESGLSKTYKVVVNRLDNRSTNNNLASLKLSSGTFKFYANTTSYDVTVDKSISKVSIIAILADSKAQFVSGYGPRSISLNTGKNTAYVKVMSENGNIKTYTLNITRESDVSNTNGSNNDNPVLSKNADLKSITLSSGKISFDKDKLNYTLSVDNDVSKITIVATPVDSNAKVEGIGEKDLKVGENKFTIKVTAEDKTVKNYTLIITRKDQDVIKIEPVIKNISIKGYNINFDVDVKEYLIKTNDRQLEIEVILSDKEAKYEIVGNKDLKDGSIIKIIVNDKDGNEEIYKLEIKSIEETSSIINDDIEDINYIPIIMESILIILIIIFIVLIAKKYKRGK